MGALIRMWLARRSSLAGEALQVFLVVAAQVVLAQRDAGAHGVQVEHHVLHVRMLGLAELRFVGLVVGLQFVVGGRDLGGEVLGVETGDLDLAALVERVQREARRLLASERGAQHAAHHLAEGEFAAYVGFEALGREALRAHQCAIGLCVQRAIGALERGDGGNALQRAGQLGVARDQVHLDGGGLHHAVAHQALQRGVAGAGRIQQPGIDRGRLRADAVGFHPVRVVPVILGDVMAIHARHHGALAGEVVPVDAHEHKRRNDQQEQHDHDDLGVLADGFEHGFDLSVATKEKANSRSPFDRWWVLTGSNRRPTPCKGIRLPLQINRLEALPTSQCHPRRAT